MPASNLKKRKMSSKLYRQKKSELSAKEKLLLSSVNNSSSKIKKIALWSLAAGLIALIGWGIYKSFTPTKSEKKKRKKGRRKIPKNYPAIDAILEQIAPQIGNWILKEFRTKK